MCGCARSRTLDKSRSVARLAKSRLDGGRYRRLIQAGIEAAVEGCGVARATPPFPDMDLR